MKIRKAKRKDIPRILELLNSDANLTGNDELSYNIDCSREYVLGKFCKTFVAEKNEKVLAMITLKIFRIAKYAELYIISVDKRYQGKGIGQKLIKFAEEDFKKSKIDFVYFYTLTKNKAMQNLGGKMNYEQGKKHYFYSKGDIK